MSVPRTLGELRRSAFSEERLRTRRVKDELRDNLVARLREKGDASVFPGIVGYDDTVVPQIINAILSRHNFILLGLRGQAKSRILRALTTLLDPQMPYLAGCEIHDILTHRFAAGAAMKWRDWVTKLRLRISRRTSVMLKSWRRPTSRLLT